MKMENDDTRYGWINEPGDVDYYAVFLGYDGKANFWLGNIPSGKDFDLYLVDENNRQLAESKGTGDQEQIYDYEVSGSETYYMKVVGYNSSYDTENQYTVRAKMSQYAHATDDVGNTCPDSIMLSKNISRSGRIDYAGDVDVYSLSFNTVPGVDNNKVYQVYTTGSLDTYGVLSVYDSSSDWDYEIGYYDVATDDNSGASNNFEIVEHIPDTYLMDGTVIYYIKVSAYGNAVGNYTVHFEEAPDDAGDSFSSASIALTTAGEYDDAWDVPQFWLNNINDVDYFRFAAPKDGVYWAVFDLLGNIYDYELKIYDESHNLIKEIDDEYDDWYRGDKVTLEAGKDYYIKVASGYDVEQYAIQIFYESDGDDWKDTFEGDFGP